MQESRLLWTPTSDIIVGSNLRDFMMWLEEHKGLIVNSYEELWNWSVNHIAEFWQSQFEYFDIMHDGNIDRSFSGTMPGVRWFEGVRLNYAEHIFRKASDERPAIIFKSENSEITQVSWNTLKGEVSSIQKFLRDQGVKHGDRVIGFLPCIPEATSAMLATVSLGAIWSSCSPDFGTNAVVDRFAQIEPKVLIAVDSYSYGGKKFDKREVIGALLDAIPSLQHVILIGHHVEEFPKPVTRYEDVISVKSTKLDFVRVPFDHPIWILYSSGTTGLPKAIVHSQGGILLEQLKYGTFHNDFHEGENCFWYTTTGWMMWNYIHGSLLAGSTMILYDGSPGYPDLNVLWSFASKASIHHFGTSAGFILANMKADIKPNQFDLSGLRSIGSTGSTLPPEGFDWIYQKVKGDVWLASMSGGTDVCSAFVGGNPTLPVYAGEIQCRALGCKVEAFNDSGDAVVGEEGEMVITEPMPSMPIAFWNDPQGARYTESYFEMFPGIWRHGDWIEITSRGGVVIYGRSDATLNRGGIRIGTSEIYRATDKVREVKDSLIICIERPGGEFWMPLFVVLHDGVALTEDLKKKINATIRSEYTPRHVPDEIIVAPDVPYTISGKKTETPVKKVLMGKDPKKVVNVGSLRNPQAMDFFIQLFKSRQP